MLSIKKKGSEMASREGAGKDFRAIPKRKIGEAEKQIIAIKIEKMKLEREKSLLILGGGVILFIAFIIVAIVGLLNNLITQNQLNMLVLAGLIVLVIGLFPYMRFVVKEQKDLENTLEELVS